MGRGSSKVGEGGSGEFGRMLPKDRTVAERMGTVSNYKILKKNVKNGEGETMSLDDAIRRESRNLSFYRDRIKNTGSFENFYKNETAASIRYMTGKNTWDKATARKYYNSRKDQAAYIVKKSREALKLLEAEEKRRSKKK